MVTALIFSNTYWTFWDVMLFFFIWIPLVMLWFFCMIDVFRRRDLSGLGKALWLVAIVIFPWIGSIVYLIARPKEAMVYGPDGGYGYGSPSGAGYAEPAGARPPAADQR
jgi:hypothetical protein